MTDTGDAAPTGGLRLAVLVSGAGTNLQAILDTVHGRHGIAVACVASNQPEARGLERARAAGIPTGVFPAGAYPDRGARDGALADFLAGHGVELVVLAGFMELLSPAFVRRFRDRIINVHPSLLPAFPGVRALEQAVDYGVRVTGATVHFVDEGVDTGPIILQQPVALPYPADIAALEAEIHAVEHRLLPRAIRLIARGAVRVARGPDGRARVTVDEHRGAGA